jgi:thiamine pyrophosphokinase
MRLSLWPMGPGAGRSEGLRWPLDGIAFRPDGRVATSNEAEGPVRLELEGGPWALVLPRAGLDAALAGLGLAPA